MPTTDERREVAARLRAIDDTEWTHPRDELRALDEAIGTSQGMLYATQATWERLADLIEPEPEKMCRNEATGSDFKCSECGCSVVGSAYWTEANICNGDWNFCPNCGAKVVE